MALSPDGASYRFDNLRRYQGASVHQTVAPLRPCQRYPRNLTITCASEPHGVKMSPVQKSQTQFGGSHFQRCYRRRGSLSLAPAGGLPCARASCRPMASAIRRMRGSRGSPLCDPLSLAGQGPLRSSSFAMPTLPRQGPSDENSQEFHDGSQKLESSTCGVEMPAGGGALLSYLLGKPMPGRRNQVKAASREAGARDAPALENSHAPSPFDHHLLLIKPRSASGTMPCLQFGI